MTTHQKIEATWKRLTWRRVAHEILARSWALGRWAGFVGVFLVLLLGVYNQPYYPSSWLDEGFVLQGPINLVRFGQYAMKSVEGFRILDQPLIANGPGVVIPISAIFALFGVGLLPARLVMVGYLVLTASLFFTVAKRMYGLPAAWIASFLLLAWPPEGFLWFGRFAVGNVPALAYFLAGYHLWLTFVEQNSWKYAFGAGLLFGVALVTKGQYILLIPTLLGVVLLDQVYYKIVSFKKISLVLLVLTGCLGVWYGAQLALVGWENFDQHLEAIHSSSRVTVSAFRPVRIPGNLGYLIHSGLPVFVGPGLLYAAWSCRKRTLSSCRHLLLVVFVLVWLGWYLFASAGWPRYAFEPYAIGLLFSGKFVVEAIFSLQKRNDVVSRRIWPYLYLRWGTLLLILALFLGGLWGFARQVRNIVAEPDRSLQQFAAYLRHNVSSQAIIESWEWQVDILADLIYHHPPNAWVDDMTAVMQFGEAPQFFYDPFAKQPDYLIDGPWSKWVNLYTPYLVDNCCALVFSAGPYDLYKVNMTSLLAKTSTASEFATEAAWPMAAANPQRTSWTPEEVRGQLYPVWYKPIEPYIPQKVQIIAANGLLYISTAGGLYALNAKTGAEAWVYPTELPLGHSPTIYKGVAYVGGFDKKLHAINAITGAGIWTFEAGAGFQTNPLVLEINGHTYVYAGNRGGVMYALEDKGSRARLVWQYQTDAPILFSAAYLDNIIYFASDDAHAYALNAQTGSLVWKSAKLLGAGFHSWWPVLYQNPAYGADVVILGGSSSYRRNLAPGPLKSLDFLNRDDIYPNHLDTPQGTPVGPRQVDGWINATRIAQYLEDNPDLAPADPDQKRLYKPWRRTYFVLDRATGQEVTFDTDGDGYREYAPILYHHNQSGNRYPAVIGSDGILYQTNNYMSGPWITGVQVSGWKIGTPLISTPSSTWIAADEPVAYSAGGHLIYWNHCCDRSAGAFDISIPNTRFWDNGDPGLPDPTREWMYFNYDLEDILPGYDIMYGGRAYGGNNGLYQNGGDQNPPIPYQGKVYIHRSNSVIAFAPQARSPVRLPLTETIEVTRTHLLIPGEVQLKQQLADEIQKIVEAGHLRPGYMNSGLFDGMAQQICGDNLSDYWHNPSDTLYTLIWALPYLPEALQQRTRDYLRSEFAAYPPYAVVHVGWQTGVNRDSFIYPPEIKNDFANHSATIWSSYGFEGWGEADTSARFPPHMFYALWKYAQVFGGATDIFDQSKDDLEVAPADEILAKYPFVVNAYIAGYLGYLELEKLAGYPESANIRLELDRLLDFRAATFSKDIPSQMAQDCGGLVIARNFMFLVPETGQYLHDHALNKVTEAIEAYIRIAPYWFVSRFEGNTNEGTIHPLYDYYALFQAKALILNESQEELAKYLDVPAFTRGDLFYIQNLIATLAAPSSLNMIYLPILLKNR